MTVFEEKNPIRSRISANRARIRGKGPEAVTNKKIVNINIQPSTKGKGSHWLSTL
ncbi:hypothetical protein J8TS2_15940 [Lederbergia ruris]|uniref:Uncharacterized protein n=1 Tax=Lederbergia ruris TaxID=217495 RepID=A0ABQ4KH31_9BACI|nr:hypothetical protein [Lederbergia ruris]GIN57275.1 hypothetical protein J8TS2_15940 [Lederbergia ruris]